MWGRFIPPAFLVFILDRLAKSAALKNLTEGEPIKVLPGIFHVTLVMNSGAAFGLFQNQTAFFIALTMLAVALIIFYAWKEKAVKPLSSFALSLILGGALGNLFDRIVFGRVIDFLDFRVWPVFNVADSAITVGSIILTFEILRQKSKYFSK